MAQFDLDCVYRLSDASKDVHGYAKSGPPPEEKNGSENGSLNGSSSEENSKDIFKRRSGGVYV